MKVSNWGSLTDRIAYARVVILLHLYSLEQCLDPVFQTSITTHNFVTFYDFLINLGVHHTWKICISYVPVFCTNTFGI
jgi:hypothetical protein